MLRLVVLLQENVIIYLYWTNVVELQSISKGIIQKVANKWKAAETLEYHE